MASLLRTLSLTAGLLRSAPAAAAVVKGSLATASPMAAWMGWMARPAVGGALQQTRGMKVHSSVKKRLFDERLESDTTGDEQIKDEKKLRTGLWRKQLVDDITAMAPEERRVGADEDVHLIRRFAL
ncbi:hypothetical protein MKX07_002102 [Trichoderma sp. CBMAI-0711]|nr:hypothetical protein MKX07_002102 [Trichoderma sp. CBMAI-0711]